MIGKNRSPEELLSYPLTSVPLALASPGGDLRQGSKAALRNHLIEDADALTTHPAAGAFQYGLIVHFRRGAERPVSYN